MYGNICFMVNIFNTFIFPSKQSGVWLLVIHAADLRLQESTVITCA